MLSFDKDNNYICNKIFSDAKAIVLNGTNEKFPVPNFSGTFTISDCQNFQAFLANLQKNNVDFERKIYHGSRKLSDSYLKFDPVYRRLFMITEF